jgi:hypothetical protein
MYSVISIVDLLRMIRRPPDFDKLFPVIFGRYPLGIIGQNFLKKVVTDLYILGKALGCLPQSFHDWEKYFRVGEFFLFTLVFIPITYTNK